jgi:hypothetical protein
MLYSGVSKTPVYRPAHHMQAEMPQQLYEHNACTALDLLMPHGYASLSFHKLYGGCILALLLLAVSIQATREVSWLGYLG